MKIIGNKNALHTPEFHKKKQTERRIRGALISVVVLITIIVPIFVLRNSHFLITSIEIKGNVVTKSEELESIITDDLAGNYLWVIPRSSTFLYPRTKIQNDLMEREPRLKFAQVSLLNPKSLSLSIAERTPSALYCKDISDVFSPVNCYFLDSSGYIFSEAPAFSGGVYFVYSSDPNLETSLRSQYLESKKFLEIDAFIKSLADIGLYPKVFVFTHEEYHLILSNGAVIMWKETQNLNQIYSNLSSFVKDSNFQKDKNNLSNIQYIDLRFGNKIFYKYR